MRLLMAALIGTGSLLGAQPVWRVDPAPQLAIKASTANGEAVFGTATWATRLPTGEIALADGGGLAVQLFGPDGRLRRTFGREGRGPGEFRSIGWIGQCGADSLYAWDFVLSRMSVLHPTAGYARVWTNAEIRSAQHATCSGAAEFAFSVRFRRNAQSRPVVSEATSIGGAYRIYRDTFDVQSYDRTGTPLRSVDAGDRRESLVGTLPDGRRSMFGRPLGAATRYAFADDLLVIAHTDSDTVRLFDRAGKTRGAFRVPVTPRRTTSEDHEAAVEEIVLSVPAFAREQFGLFGRSVPRVERMPAFSELLTDPAGVIWLQSTGPSSTQTRLVGHGTDGTAVASLTIPVAMTVFEIGREHVLGRTEDADGEQQVVLYRFTRR